MIRNIRMDERGGRGCAARNAAWKVSTLLELLVVFALGNMVQDTNAYHGDGMCVQLGQYGGVVDRYDRVQRHGPWTIGTRKFDIKYNYLDHLTFKYQVFQENSQADKDKACPYNYKLGPDQCLTSKDPPLTQYTYCSLTAEPCVDDKDVEIRTYAVKQNGKVMYGWLHFEIELKDPNDKMLAIYVQVRDEWFNAIGEFVSDSNEQCEPSDSGLVKPTEYQVLPCAAVGLREAKLANAVFMAEKNVYRNETLVDKFIPKSSISRGIHFTWRLSEYWCNRHYRFRPEAFILTQKHVNKLKLQGVWTGGIYTKPLLYRKAANYWLHPRWFGTADIKLPKTTLSCNEKLIDYSSGNVDQNLAPWLHEKGILGILSNDYVISTQYYVSNSIWYIKSCQWDNVKMLQTTGNYPNAPFAKDIAPTFAGRCKHHYEKETSHDNLQGCNLDASAPEFADVVNLNFPTYTDWVQNLTINRTNLCTVTCKVPTPENLTDINKFADRTEEHHFNKKVIFNSASRNSSKTEKLLVGKKYHATLCIIWTMFFTPLGIFCARYFKETCMHVTCTGAHFWFWIHIATAAAGLGVFISSLSGIWGNIDTWGRNIDIGGICHRYVGYVSIALFALMMVLGGYRPIDKTKRIVLMTVHSVLGFLIYLLNLSAMILSFFIPGSPTIGQCDEMGYSTEMSLAIYPIYVWIGIDVFLHIAMTILQTMKDRSVGFRRPWYCPIIPILPHDSADDFVGSSLRKITLMVYGGAALIMTCSTIGLIHLKDVPPEECHNRTGTTDCHEVWGCSNTARAYARKILQSKSSSGTYKVTTVFQW